MDHYHHSFTIAATPASTHAALATIPGLRAWWTEECEGQALAGGILEVRFGNTEKDMRVERSDAGEVRWTCIRAHLDVPSLARQDEWVGTVMVFSLSDTGAGETRLDFSHIGLSPSVSCYDICTEGWRHFLASLRSYLETGTGTPYRSPASHQERSIAA